MKNLILIAFLLFGVNAHAQELNCTVTIQPPQVDNYDAKVYETLETAIYEFLNNRKWTKDVYNVQERIECNILITITNRPSVDQFSGNLQIQSRRPVYNTSYSSPVFVYKDPNMSFEYAQYQPLEFSEGTHISNLTSILAYYAYVVLGYDYDTFSELGGTKYFQKARDIVSNAQGAPEKGWKAFEGDKNRYWLVENILNQRFTPMRKAMYQYHREGLDIMAEKMEEGREEIKESLTLLDEVHKLVPLSFNMQVFFLSKGDELVNIFKKSEGNQQAEVINLLSKMDPANSGKYNKIREGK